MPPAFLSRLESEEGTSGGPGALRDFLETLVARAVEAHGLVVGEAEPGRYLLVMPPLEVARMQSEIDAGLDLVLDRLGRRWSSPRVTDFGLKELYAQAREHWLAPRRMEDLVREGKIGVVTILCHDWLYGIAAQVAAENGLRVETKFEEYLRTGRLRVAARTSFEIDVFANMREMAADFYPVDHLIAKVLVLAEVGRDETLAARVSGHACPTCGAFVSASATTCASCGAAV